MSPIVPPARSEPRSARVLGAFFASLVVHALVAVVVVLAWPSRAPQRDHGPPPLQVELVPPTSPLLQPTAAAPAAAPVSSGQREVAGGGASAPVTSAVATTRREASAAPSVVATTAQAAPSPTASAAMPERAAAAPFAMAASGPVIPARPAAPAPPVVDDGMPAVAGGDPDDLVRAWLAMHQHYPRAARRHRIEGTVTLAFALDARGKVVRAAIDGTSGSRVLDRAALDLLGRAEPFPVVATEASAELPFEIEVEYRLANLGAR
jgi:protein TonB